MIDQGTSTECYSRLRTCVFCGHTTSRRAMRIYDLEMCGTVATDCYTSLSFLAKLEKGLQRLMRRYLILGDLAAANVDALIC